MTPAYRPPAFIFEFIEHMAERSPSARKLLTAPLRVVDQGWRRAPISAEHLKLDLRATQRGGRDLVGLLDIPDAKFTFEVVHRAVLVLRENPAPRT